MLIKDCVIKEQFNYKALTIFQLKHFKYDCNWLGMIYAQSDNFRLIISIRLNSDGVSIVLSIDNGVCSYSLYDKSFKYTMMIVNVTNIYLLIKYIFAFLLLFFLIIDTYESLSFNLPNLMLMSLIRLTCRCQYSYKGYKKPRSKSSKALGSYQELSLWP